jgi:NADH:ubiquinone oxidoreductase subunit 4 (subunit M)
MKKILPVLTFTALIIPVLAMAEGISNPLRAQSFKDLADTIINFIFWIAITIVPIMVIVAGFMFVTAGGSPQRVDTAKKMMLYTAIGFAIVLLAKGLISVLKSVIGG